LARDEGTELFKPGAGGKLQEASRTVPEPHPWKYKERTVEIEIKLPPHSVAAITVEFA